MFDCNSWYCNLMKNNAVSLVKFPNFPNHVKIKGTELPLAGIIAPTGHASCSQMQAFGHFWFINLSNYMSPQPSTHPAPHHTALGNGGMLVGWLYRASASHMLRILYKLLPTEQASWGQYGAHLGPKGPRRASCLPHEPCYLGINSYNLSEILVVFMWC